MDNRKMIGFKFINEMNDEMYFYLNISDDYLACTMSSILGNLTYIISEDYERDYNDEDSLIVNFLMYAKKIVNMYNIDEELNYDLFRSLITCFREDGMYMKNLAIVNSKNVSDSTVTIVIDFPYGSFRIEEEGGGLESVVDTINEYCSSHNRIENRRSDLLIELLKGGNNELFDIESVITDILKK